MLASPISPPPPLAPHLCTAADDVVDVVDANGDPATGSSHAGFGVALAALGALISSVAMLIGKRSADVEAGLPLCRRWRWWTFFVINTSAEVTLSSVALMLAPLSLIAPCAGLAVIFSALLARAGCIAGVSERLSGLEWASLLLTVVGIICCSFFGPQEPSRVLPFQDYGHAFASPPFLIYASLAATVVSGWLALLLLPSLRHHRRRAEHMTFVFPLISAYGAGTCGSFSIVWQSIFVHAASELCGSLGVQALHYWVSWASLAGLIACAPTQLYLLNAALATGKASYTVPVYTVNSIANGIIVSGLLFHDFDCLETREALQFFSAFLAVLVGVAILSSLQGQRATNALKDLRASCSVGPNDTNVEPDTAALAIKLEQQWRLALGGVSALYCLPDGGGSAGSAIIRSARAPKPCPPKPCPAVRRRTFSAGDLRITVSPCAADGASDDDAFRPLPRFGSHSTGHLASAQLAPVLLGCRGAVADAAARVTHDGVLRSPSLLDAHTHLLGPAMGAAVGASSRGGLSADSSWAVQPLPSAPVLSSATVASVNRRV